MILYKYLSLETARKVIKKPSVRFTKSYYLNDPFEVTSCFYESADRDYRSEDNAFNHLKISDSYGILSLTRAALNPLMWSHYAKGEMISEARGISLARRSGKFEVAHGGMVIGIDTDKAGLNNEGVNLIPAKFGSVIYTTSKPTGVFEGSENQWIFEGMQHSFNSNMLESLQRLFLYKSSHWSYEEEVRVVRNVHRSHVEEFRNTGVCDINKDSISEAYIGSAHLGYNKSIDILTNEIKNNLPWCKVFQCDTRGKTWDVFACEI